MQLDVLGRILGGEDKGAALSVHPAIGTKLDDALGSGV